MTAGSVGEMVQAVLAILESRMNVFARYGMNWLRWLDEGLNVLTGGDANETLSSRAGKAARAKRTWACVLCKVLDWISPNHCERSINRDDGANATLPDA